MSYYTSTAYANKVTPAQINFIKSLLKSRDVTEQEIAHWGLDLIEDLTKKGASMAIDFLKTRPFKADAKITPFVPRSAVQSVGPVCISISESPLATESAYQKMIETAHDAPAAEKLVAADLVPEGFYSIGSDIYRVVTNKAGTKRYAKLMTVVNGKRRFSYAVGVITSLTLRNKVTPIQAKMFGDTHHFCLCCGKELTVELSIQRGIGPVCWVTYGFAG